MQILLLNHSYPPPAALLSSHNGFLTVTFSHCSSVPKSSIPSSIFRHFQSTNQSPAQFTSDSNLASIAMLIPAASRSAGQMQRTESGKRQSQLDTSAPLVSLNLSKVLCQVFPVHSCIPFSSLKVTQKDPSL